MLTANDVIQGWSPAGDDDVEVNVSQDMCFMTIKPTTSSTSFLSPICPPLNATLSRAHSHPFPSTPFAALMDVTRTTIAPSSDRRAQRNRNRDPSWIPRPRNAFIIFRCEYSREHAQGLQGSQDDSNNTGSVKTLSKRAAEAWKQLTPSEKERYKALADIEREEHARLYPHYRFRPMKRQASGTRRSPRERSQSPKETSIERHHAPSVEIPSVLATAPERPRPNASVERTEVSAPMPQVSAALFPEQLSCPIGLAQTDLEVPPCVDLDDHVPFYPSPEATLSSDSPPPSDSTNLYSPLCTSPVSIPPDPFHCDDSPFGLESTHEGVEKAQGFAAYSIGLYNHELFSPFTFPEYY